MVHRSRLSGVATWVLRPGATATEVLLLPAARRDEPAWGPVRGDVGEEETEAAAALRSLARATGLERDRRVYASPVASFASGPGLVRVGVFVAIVAADAEPDARGEPGAAWVPLRDASARLSDPQDRASLAEVDARFVRAAPDESLRVA